MMRPHLRAFMPGTAARMAWKAADRLIAMMASHLSIGNSSIGATCWMPALLTSTSTEPNVDSAVRIISAISAGLVMSAGEWIALTENSFSMPARSFSIAALSPKPLITMLAPSRAMARAMPSPIPEVEPVTTAVFCFNMALTCLLERAPTIVLAIRCAPDQGPARRRIALHYNCAASSCRFRLRGQPLVDGAAPPDIAEMGVEKAPRSALPELVQRQEELEVDVEPAAGVEGVAVHHDAVQPGAAGAAELQRPQLRNQRRVEGDLVHAGHDLARRGGQLQALARVDLHDQNVGARSAAQERQHNGVAAIAAVPVGHAIDLDRTEQERQAGRRHHHLGRDLLAREHARLASQHIGGGDEQITLAGADALEVDEAPDQIPERIDVERIEIVGRKKARKIAEPRQR